MHESDQQPQSWNGSIMKWLNHEMAQSWNVPSREGSKNEIVQAGRVHAAYESNKNTLAY